MNNSTINTIVDIIRERDSLIFNFNPREFEEITDGVDFYSLDYHPKMSYVGVISESLDMYLSFFSKISEYHGRLSKIKSTIASDSSTMWYENPKVLEKTKKIVESMNEFMLAGLQLTHILPVETGKATGYVIQIKQRGEELNMSSHFIQDYKKVESDQELCTYVLADIFMVSNPVPQIPDDVVFEHSKLLISGLDFERKKVEQIPSKLILDFKCPECELNKDCPEYDNAVEFYSIKKWNMN